MTNGPLSTILRRMSKKTNEKGYTIVELMLCIGIIGILSVVGITAFNAMRGGDTSGSGGQGGGPQEALYQVSSAQYEFRNSDKAESPNDYAESVAELKAYGFLPADFDQDFSVNITTEDTAYGENYTATLTEYGGDTWTISNNSTEAVKTN